MVRYHDCQTDPCLRKDLRLDREVLGPALLRLVLGWGTDADVEVVKQAIVVLQSAAPHAAPRAMRTRRRKAE